MHKINISKSNERKYGALLSYIQMGLSMLTGLIYTPFMIRLLGDTEYGLYGTVMSFVSLLGLLDMGFTSSYVKFYTKYRMDDDKKKISGFNLLFFFVFFVIAVIAMTIGIFFSFKLEWVFNTGLTTQEYHKAKIMMILLTVSIGLGFLTTVYNSYISANENFVFLKVLGVVSTVISVVLNLIVLKLEYGAVGLVVVSLFISVATKAVTIAYAYKTKITFSFKDIPKGVIKQVFAFSGLIALNMIVDKVNTGLDSVLLGRFCGTSAVAVYTVGASLSNYFTNFSTAISGVFVPRVHEIVNSYEMDSKEQRKSLTLFFTRVGRIQFLFLGLILTGFIFFGKAFVCFWAGEGYDNSYYIALLLMIPSIVPLIQNVGIEIQRAENRHNYRSYIYSAMAVLNLIISIFLCQLWQGVGCAIGTAFATIVANGIIMNIVYHKKINIDMIYFWKSILGQVIGFIPPVIVGIIMLKLVNMSNSLAFAASMSLYIVIYVFSIWKLSMNDEEKQLIKDLLYKIKRKA